jgi:hypothetical protein
MAAASTHVDIATRADALVVVFRRIEDDSDNLNTQLQEELRGAKLLSPGDPRVKPWIDLLRAGLVASKYWVADMQQQTTRHNFDGQERYFATIQHVVNSASRCLEAFASHTEPRVETLGLLIHLVDYVEILYRNFAAWAARERHNPGINPPQLDSTHGAEMPPARGGSAQRQRWVNEDVNPGDSLARTGNPYFITGHRSHGRPEVFQRYAWFSAGKLPATCPKHSCEW